MTKKLLSIFVFCAVLFGANAQSEMRKFDFKIGAGPLFGGIFNNTLLSLDNELTYKMNNYFNASAFVTLSRGGVTNNEELVLGSGPSSSFLGGLNVTLSPFKNNKVNNFKIGTGIVWFSVSNTYLSYDDLRTKRYEYFVTDYKSAGFNLVIEDEYRIFDRYLIGAKLYLNGDKYGAYAYGALLRFGVIL